MKKVFGVALVLALCLGLAAPALAADTPEEPDAVVNAGGNVDSMSTWEGGIGESLDQPVPLPAHMAGYEDLDSWLFYDFDYSKVLEITRDEWDNRTYVVLEGTEFTVWQNPNWRGAVIDMYIGNDADETDAHYFYSAREPDTVEEIRYMPPMTITFGHDVTMPDGSVMDLAKLGESYGLHFTVSWEEEPGVMPITWLGESFQVIPAVAYASTQTVEVDGEAVEFQMYAIKDANGNDTNYVKVRDVALALDGTAAQFNVGWDGAVNLEKGKAYTARNGQENNTPYSGDQPFVAATAATNVDGENAYLAAFVITDASGNGSTYYKLRDLGEALGFTVDWSAERGIFVETK